MTIGFSAGALAANDMSKNEYKAAGNKIAGEYKAAKADCSALSANAKDVCMAEATGNSKIAKAELDARYKPSAKASYTVSIAKAEAEYAVVRERCDEKAGNDKTVCVNEAKAAEAREKSDAKKQLQASQPKGSPASTSSSKNDTPGEYVDDAVITTKVKAAVLEESSLKSAEINVETSKGTVQLSGFVRSRADINKAVEVAKGVKGVKAVKNDMILKGTQ